jgi:alkylhydroperoxidase/carboxymuconolactone decarboxylase family protein YurZ
VKLSSSTIAPATIDTLDEWDPTWTEKYSRMASNPWISGALTQKDIELICVALNASITNMDAPGLRRHIRAALHHGATRVEILEVLKMAAILALHSMSLGAPIVVEEAQTADVTRSSSTSKPAIPTVEQMKSLGQWNDAWGPFLELDPLWTEQFIEAGAGFYTSGVLPPKFVELVSIAYDASITHMYAPGTRRHIRAALKLGASVEQIMDVLKLCVTQGANALDFGVPILAEEAKLYEAKGALGKAPAP